jgi:uncharacterized protein YciI
MYMFVLNFHNLQDVNDVDKAADQHRAFLDKYIEAGIFLVAGAKIPRSGGIVIAQGVDRAQIEEIVKQAPFERLGLAKIEIIEFKAVLVAADVPLAPKEPRFVL